MNLLTKQEIEKLHHKLPDVTTSMMRGDNLAILLCSHFDDGEPDEESATGWSKAAEAGYEEVVDAIRAHYDPAIRTALALMAQLDDANAAQALVVERAAAELEPAPNARDGLWVRRLRKAQSRIRALADPSGVEALAALRAERDGYRDAGRGVAVEAADLRARLAAAEAQVAALREAGDKARDPGRDPDYCYDEEWEYTMRWDEAHDLLDGHDLSKPVEFYTLFKGPRKWAVNVPNSWDEEGIPDGWDAEIFDSEAAARAALASAQGGAK